MALDFGARQVIEENYKEFTDALANLSEGEQRRVRQGYRPSIDFTERAPAFVTPGWDDVLVLGPRPVVSKDQWRLYFAEQRGGPDARLSPEIRNEINRKLRTMDRIKNSPTPFWAREVGRALTAIDNVQDLLATVAVVGRFVMFPLLRRYPATRLPILGLMAASTALNTLGLFGMLLSPLYGVICGGAGEGLAAGMVSSLKWRAGKQLLTGIGKGNRFARQPKTITNVYGERVFLSGTRAEAALAKRGLVSRIPMPGSRRVWTSAVEAVQVTKDLFGYGLSFGGLMGMVTDAAFGLESAARGQPVQLRTPRAPGVFHALFADVLARYPTTSLPDARNAAMVLTWAPWLLDPACPIDDHERQQVLYAVYCAYEFLYPVLTHPAGEEALALALDESWTPPVYRYTDTVEALTAAGLLEAPAANVWPDAPSTARLDGADYVGKCYELADAFWDAIALVPPIYSERAAFELLTTRVMERSNAVMLGGEDAVAWRESTPFALAEGLVDSGTYLDVVTNPEGVQELSDAFEWERQRPGRVFRTRAQWIDLAARFHVRAFPLLDPGDYPTPS